MKRVKRGTTLWNAVIGLFPIVFLGFVFGIRVASFETYWLLVSEDGILETIQFACYVLAGSVLLVQLWVLTQKPGQVLLKTSLLLLSGALLCMSFEEISWGERLLNYRNPDFFTVYNTQKEVSLHNLVFFQQYLHTAYILVGLVLGVVMPLVSQSGYLKKFRPYLFGWNMFWYFIPLSVVYAILVVVPPVSLQGFSALGFIWRDQEVVETLLAAGLLVWVVQVFQKKKV